MRRSALLVSALVLIAGCGASSEPGPAAVKAALEARFAEKHLSFEWVYCLRTPRTFEGERVFRCNVNFGEPHIVRYCATLDGGRLLTNYEQPALRCGRRATS